jgi:hypothetical protein
MTKPFGLIDSILETLQLAENFGDFALQMCVNMADPTQLSGLGGGSVDNKIVSFIFLTGIERRIFLVKFFTQFLPGPGKLYQNFRDWNLHYVYHPQKIADKVASADWQKINAKQFRRPILKEDRQKCFGIYVYIII